MTWLYKVIMTWLYKVGMLAILRCLVVLPKVILYLLSFRTPGWKLLGEKSVFYLSPKHHYLSIRTRLDMSITALIWCQCTLTFHECSHWMNWYKVTLLPYSWYHYNLFTLEKPILIGRPLSVFVVLMLQTCGWSGLCRTLGTGCIFFFFSAVFIGLSRLSPPRPYFLKYKWFCFRWFPPLCLLYNTAKLFYWFQETSWRR